MTAWKIMLASLLPTATSTAAAAGFDASHPLRSEPTS